MVEPLLDQLEAIRNGLCLDEGLLMNSKTRSRLYSELCWGLYSETRRIQATIAAELREDA